MLCYKKAENPPHLHTSKCDDDENIYDCLCTACDAWRAARIHPGQVVRPCYPDPSIYHNSLIPTWRPDSFSKTRWDHRRPHTDVYVVLQNIEQTSSSKDSIGQLDNGQYMDVCLILGLPYNDTPAGFWVIKRARLRLANAQYWPDGILPLDASKPHEW